MAEGPDQQVDITKRVVRNEYPTPEEARERARRAGSGDQVEAARAEIEQTRAEMTETSTPSRRSWTPGRQRNRPGPGRPPHSAPPTPRPPRS